ncbi:MAG: DNA polymerase III subunit gamma/tau [Candidatus Marinimicrobia bacterium]|nr:DNA polymerase III subunit gamma/tau [Candidatus Neomarinimicrobiota bacterium]
MAEQESPYIVSSLKYRPQTFEDVVGQDHISRTLKNAILSKKLANGYIFTGPRGVGKTTTARILAKALNCENPTDGNPCNTCNHCIEITAGRSMDVFEVDGASTRGIDAIRGLREVVKYPPSNSNYRVYIIDEVHMLTKEAFNALLKTLEEPPPQVLFIFATTEPQKVPLTILSRCQRYDFRMISMELMVDRLKMICRNEGINLSDEGLTLIARKAAGSLRDSQSLLDQVAAYADGEADLELVRQVLGVLDVTIYFDIMHHVASQAADNLLNQANLLFSRGIAITEFLQGLSEHVRNLLVVKVAGATDFLELSDKDKAAFQEQAGYFEERDLLRMQSLITQTLRDQRFVSNQIVSTELLLLKLARASRALDIDAILSGEEPAQKPVIKPKPVETPVLETKPAPKKKTVEAKPKPEPESKPEPEAKAEVKTEETPAPVVPPVEPPEPESSEPQPSVADSEAGELDFQEDILPKWGEFTNKLESVGRTIGVFMEEGTPKDFKKNCLSVAFAPEQKYHVQTLTKSLREIEKVAVSTFGTKMTIKLLEQNGHKPKKRKNDEILSHPNSQHLLDIFDGEIIDD